MKIPCACSGTGLLPNRNRTGLKVCRQCSGAGEPPPGALLKEPRRRPRRRRR